MLQIRAIAQDDEKQDLSDARGRARALTLNSGATVTKHACHLMFHLRAVDCVCERPDTTVDAS